MMTDGGHARPARSPDTKAALDYLIASGAVAITITERDGVWPHRLAGRFHDLRDGNCSTAAGAHSLLGLHRRGGAGDTFAISPTPDVRVAAVAGDGRPYRAPQGFITLC